MVEVMSFEKFKSVHNAVRQDVYLDTTFTESIKLSEMLVVLNQIQAEWGDDVMVMIETLSDEYYNPYAEIGFTRPETDAEYDLRYEEAYKSYVDRHNDVNSWTKLNRPMLISDLEHQKQKIEKELRMLYQQEKQNG